MRRATGYRLPSDIPLFVVVLNYLFFCTTTKGKTCLRMFKALGYIYYTYNINNSMKKGISREEKIEKAIELRKDGRSQRQIAEWLGVGQSTIQRWLIEFAPVQECTPAKSEGSDGKEYPAEKPTGNELTERRQKVKTLQSEGKRPPEIAEELGVSERTVYNDLKAIEKLDINEDKQKRRKKKRENGDRIPEVGVNERIYRYKHL